MSVQFRVLVIDEDPGSRDYLQAWADAIPGLRYTAKHQNKLVLGNHLQGIQRLRRGQRQILVLDRGDDRHD